MDKKKENFVRRRGIYGFLIKEYRNSSILYQPENGPKGTYVFVPRTGLVFAGSLSDCKKEAKEYSKVITGRKRFGEECRVSTCIRIEPKKRKLIMEKYGTVQRFVDHFIKTAL